MSLEAVFLSEILASPEDDTPRRIYADWLMDQPEPHLAARGDFIHLQCELAARGEDDPEVAELRAHARAKLNEHGHTWCRDLDEFVRAKKYHRGFADEIVLPAPTFLDHAAKLYALAPIRGVRLTDATGRLRDLAASPYLAPLTTLDLRDNLIRDRGLAELAQSPYAANLVTLDLSRNPLAIAGLRGLMRGTMLPALKVLRLNGTRLGFAGLTELLWSRSAPTSAGPLIDRITSLVLADCELSAEAIARLWFRFPAEVRDLDLSRNGIGAGDMYALSGRAWRNVGRLERLNLSGNDISPAGAEVLNRLGGTDRLVGIDLSQNNLGDDGVDALESRYSSRRWSELTLASNDIGPAGTRTISEMKGAEFLRKLDLSRNAVGADGAEVLAASRPLAGLTDLDLSHNKLGPAGVENLVSQPRLVNLKRLGLAGNGIGSRGVRALLESPHIEGLLWLDVSGNKLDPEDARRLGKRFGARVRV